MYGNMHVSFEEGIKALNEWNRLYLVPGAAHCAPSDDQPNGPFPRTILEILIEWVEDGKKPDRFNVTIMSSSHEGEQQDLCAWPLRPLWKNNGSTLYCVFQGLTRSLATLGRMTLMHTMCLCASHQNSMHEAKAVIWIEIISTLSSCVCL